MNLYSGYGEWKFCQRTVRERVSQVIKAIKELRLGYKFDGVALTGSSGVWLGAALMASRSWPSDLKLVHVRKPKESSHGSEVEGRGTVKRAVLVDDFVSSGETVRRVVDTLTLPSVSGNCGIEVVAVIEHEYLKGRKGLRPRDPVGCYFNANGVPVYMRSR